MSPFLDEIFGEYCGGSSCRRLLLWLFDLGEGEPDRYLPTGNEFDEIVRRAVEALPTGWNGFDEEPPPAGLDDRTQPAAFIGRRMIDEDELAGQS